MAVRHKTLSERRARTAALSDRELPRDLPRVRTSERGTFKRCHWKWHLEFEQFRKPIDDIPALRFGSLIHKAMADYYPPGVKRGPNPAASFRKYYQAELEETKELFGQRVADEAAGDTRWIEAGTLGEAMLNHYVETYGKDNDWKVLVTEQRFDILVYKPWTYDPDHPPEAQASAEPWFVYCGVIDLVAEQRSTGRVWLWDHKTAIAIQTRYLSLDDQATAYYTWGWDWIVQSGLLGKKQVEPAGMMYNFLRKSIKDDRPQNDKGYYLNKNGEVSKQQPTPYFARQPIFRDWNEREKARERILIEYADMERVRREGIEQAYKNPGQFTCPSCWAFDICELDEVGAPGVEELKEATTRHWEPYHQREVYAGETR